MDSTRLFTCIQEGVLADALYEDGKLMELSLHPLEHASILGNIYIGKVRNIVKNIQAAFVEIENGMLCYLPLEDVQAPVYTKPKKEGQPLVQGDELLVQVSREAVKTKQPSVTTKISMNGKYLVFTIGNGKLGCSGKLSGAEKYISCIDSAVTFYHGDSQCKGGDRTWGLYSSEDDLCGGYESAGRRRRGSHGSPCIGAGRSALAWQCIWNCQMADFFPASISGCCKAGAY